MFFSKMDFNFAYFPNFNFVHFEIEDIFGLIWLKLQNGRFTYKFPFRVSKRCSF